MARLETIIDGSAEGLENAASRAIGILEGLQKAADKLKIDFIQAGTVEELNSVGVALTAVTGRYNDYVNAALKGNTVWQDQQATKALDALEAKLRVVAGNAELLGRTLQTDRTELRAYQQALDALLKIGLNPLDTRITGLVANIKRLTAALNDTNTTDPFARFREVPGRIANIENRLRNLRTAMRNAVETRDINKYILRIQALEKELTDLTTLGGRVDTSLNNAGQGAVRAGQGFSQFSLELGRVVQDAPYAANNFGSIGNNLTRMVEVFPNYIAQLRAAAAAQGIAASSANLWRLALRNLFTGINGISIAFSAVISAITIYTLWQTRANKAAKEGAEETLKLVRAYLDLSRVAPGIAEKRAKQLRDNLTDSISNYENALLRAEQAAASEAKELENLYKVATNENIARKDRLNAVNQLQQQYPDYFKNISDEAILAGNAEAAYNRLTTSLMNVARARVYGEEIQKNAEVEVANLRTIAELNQEIYDTEARMAQLREASLAGGTVGSGEFMRLEKVAEDARRQIELLTQDNFRLAESTSNLQQKLKQAQEDGGLLGLEKGLKAAADTSGRLISYMERLGNVLEKSSSEESGLGLTGLDAEIDKIRVAYEALYRDLNVIEERIRVDSKLTQDEKTRFLTEAARVRAQLGIDEAARLSQAEIEEARNTQDIIAGIYAKASIERFNSRERELQQLDAYYGEQRRKYRDNAEVLLALEEAYLAEKASVNSKWDAKLTNVTLEYSRRLRETQTQMLKRQLDTEFRERVKHANMTLKTEEERLNEQVKLQEEYWRRLEAVQQFERMERLANDFGDAFGRAFETSLSQGKNIFEQIYQEFRRLIIRMIAQQAALKAANIFGQLLGVGNVGNASQGGGQSTFGDLLNGLANIFSGNGQGGKWVNSVAGVFKTGGAGGRFIDNLGRVFTSNNGGGGFLRTLGSLFSSASGGGGWLGKLFGGLFGGSRYSSGNFPTGNFGGGNFPTMAPVSPGANFTPGVRAAGPTDNIVLQAKIGHDAIYLSNQMGARQNERMFGGK